MDKMKFYAAYISAQLTALGLKIFNYSATSLPGAIALKICPNYAKHLNSSFTKQAITVTGTNGKTTTAGLLAHILVTANNTVLHNEKGANMLSGVISALALNLSPFSKKDYFVLESDEAYLRKFFDQFNSSSLVVTNLFSDQLDRYGGLAATASLIQEAINKNKNLKLFLNSDDNLVSLLGEDNERIYFGMEEVEFTHEAQKPNAVLEAVECPCAKLFEYTKRFYSHLGHYSCECGYKRVEPKYKGHAKVSLEQTKLTIQVEAQSNTFIINLPGLYNAYNALAAISVALDSGITPKDIQAALDTYTAVFGRAQKLVCKGKNLFIQLIKNPVGASEVLKNISSYENAKLFIALNDNYADGRDVSWIWDANFELISGSKHKIIVSGSRAKDMALRLKHVFSTDENIIIIDNVKQAFETALNNTEKDETLIILPTYTVLMELKKYLN